MEIFNKLKAKEAKEEYNDYKNKTLNVSSYANALESLESLRRYLQNFEVISNTKRSISEIGKEVIQTYLKKKKSSIEGALIMH